MTHGARPGLRRRLADVSVRAKAALIVVPTVLVAVVSAGVGLWSSVMEAQSAGRSRVLFDVASAAGQATQRLQAERIAAVNVLLPSSTATAADFERAAQATDAAIADFDAERSGLVDPPAGVRAVLDRVDAGLADVESQRQRVRGEGVVALSAVAFGYRIVIADLDELLVSVAQGGVDPQLADEMRASVALSRAREAVGLQQVAVIQALAARRLTPALHAEIVAARAAQEEALREFQALARPRWQALLGRTLTGPDVVAVARLDGAVASTTVYQPVRLPGGAEQWSRVMTARANLLAHVQTDVDADIAATAAEVRADQLRAALAQGAVLLAMLLVAMLTALQVARSLITQLSLLESGARRVADVELPSLVSRLRVVTDPAKAQSMAKGAGGVAVPVVGRDEVGRVAHAFNGVLGAAVDATVGQARARAQVSAMIMSVGRRVQGLTELLLGSIDRLERDEEDPDRLARVFAVDQQATRLRRFANSLLIAAGGGPGQSQREPVVLADLVNAALSEVEGFARITVGNLVDAEVDPRAIDAVKQITAELLDNATRFSADEQVLVTAVWQGRDLRISVVDAGIGMRAEQLQRANVLLTSPAAEVGVTDQMGLVVISRLAAEFGVRVHLRSGEPVGLVAEVLVPADFVTRVHVRQIVVHGPARRPAAELPAPPANPYPVEAPTTGTGWTGPAAQPPDTSGRTQVLPRIPTADVTLELPRLTHAALPLPAGGPASEPPLFRQMAEASPWLWPQTAPASETARFSTASDAGWQAAAAAAEPAIDGHTVSGLPRRRPQAHVVPGGAGVPGQRRSGEAATRIDPAAIRAQVAGTMRGLRAAVAHHPPHAATSTGAPS
ncbi:nitrate- and nitrite sensing domain-containing protein [Micromonospora sp. WMMD1102]|uniref:sensor histidine kinase n=1 Tax=Micromonospora sp. WMMD1102 TaxID=3016105 RepID=UPI002415350D|nr:nitrate- and nitrite sensing domain-containing protein [Micromonospora sp. WMMD1102]MDG4784984.1 nitrate- and nitrite sensing domain-containing protein [Micromonospora sp. WMMD1102]